MRRRVGAALCSTAAPTSLRFQASRRHVKSGKKFGFVFHRCLYRKESQSSTISQLEFGAEIMAVTSVRATKLILAIKSNREVYRQKNSLSPISNCIKNNRSSAFQSQKDNLINFLRAKFNAQ